MAAVASAAAAAGRQQETTPAQQTQNICMRFIQWRTSVEDVGPALYKCHTNVLYLLGYPTII